MNHAELIPLGIWHGFISPRFSESRKRSELIFRGPRKPLRLRAATFEGIFSSSEKDWAKSAKKESRAISFLSQVWFTVSLLWHAIDALVCRTELESQVSISLNQIGPILEITPLALEGKSWPNLSGSEHEANTNTRDSNGVELALPLEAVLRGRRQRLQALAPYGRPLDSRIGLVRPILHGSRAWEGKVDRARKGKKYGSEPN